VDHRIDCGANSNRNCPLCMAYSWQIQRGGNWTLDDGYDFHYSASSYLICDRSFHRICPRELWQLFQAAFHAGGPFGMVVTVL